MVVVVVRWHHREEEVEEEEGGCRPWVVEGRQLKVVEESVVCWQEGEEEVRRREQLSVVEEAVPAQQRRHVSRFGEGEEADRRGWVVLAVVVLTTGAGH